MEHVFIFLTQALPDHWMLATFIGALVAGENAILVALIFATKQSSGMILGVLVTAYVATLIADICWYVLGKYGFASMNRKQASHEIPESMIKKLFDKHIFSSLLLIKFLVGLRVVLTLYLATKKELTFWRYLWFDSLGIILFLGVLLALAWFVIGGTGNALDTYQMIVRLVTTLVFMTFVTHLATFLIRRRAQSSEL
jgi:membrane protein DedA with SNARE-associated domain